MMRRLSRVYAGGENTATEGKPGRTILGISMRDIVFWTLATLVVFAVGVAWDVLLVDLIGDQSTNKYVLTLILLVLCGVFTALSMLVVRPRAGSAQARHRMAALFVRFGFALQLFGSVIAPIGLFHATNPTRSVPVGFAYFATVFTGLFVAGIAGNVLRPANN